MASEIIFPLDRNRRSDRWTWNQNTSPFQIEASIDNRYSDKWNGILLVTATKFPPRIAVHAFTAPNGLATRSNFPPFENGLNLNELTQGVLLCLPFARDGVEVRALDDGNCVLVVNTGESWKLVQNKPDQEWRRTPNNGYVW